MTSLRLPVRPRAPLKRATLLEPIHLSQSHFAVLAGGGDDIGGGLTFNIPETLPSAFLDD